MSLRGRRHGGGRKNELVFLTTCGPTTTFDPKITGPQGVWYFDDGTTLAAASGAEISKTFAAEGLHRAVYRPVGGLAAITRIDISGDLVQNLNLANCKSLDKLLISSNKDIVLSLSSIPKSVTEIYATMSASPNNATRVVGSIADIPRNATLAWLGYCTSIVGDLSDLPATLKYLDVQGATAVTGSIDSLPAGMIYLNLHSTGNITGSINSLTNNYQLIYTYGNPAITGDLSSLSAMTALTKINLGVNGNVTGDISDLSGCSALSHLYLFYNDNITGDIADLPASITSFDLGHNRSLSCSTLANFVNAQTMYVNLMTWTQAEVDAIISSIHAARATYTYSSPYLLIDDNSAPSGNYVSPVEGDDWHDDTGTWIPLTSAAKIYDLINDVNAEGFYKWSIDYDPCEHRLIGNVVGTGEKTWTSNSGYANTIYAQKFTADAGNLRSLKLKVTGNCNAKMAIYSNSGGRLPETRLAYTDGQACTAGWNNIRLNVNLAISAIDYWIAVKLSGSGPLIPSIAASGTSRLLADAYANEWPVAMPAMSGDGTDRALSGYGI